MQQTDKTSPAFYIRAYVQKSLSDQISSTFTANCLGKSEASLLSSKRFRQRVCKAEALTFAASMPKQSAMRAASVPSMGAHNLETTGWTCINHFNLNKLFIVLLKQ
jgi:hypothetical protein